MSTVYILCTIYVVRLKPLVLSSTFVCITCTRCSKSNYEDYTLITGRHSFIYSWSPADSDRLYSSSWNWHAPYLVYTELKWSCVLMECEHNLDKETLQHLVLQLADILTCIYQGMHSAHFEFLLYEEYQHHHHTLPLSPPSQTVGLLCSLPFWFTPS
jgi:hypothetical protein